MSSNPVTPPVVAIFNTNDDIVEMLRIALERAGLLVVSMHINEVKRGRANLHEFIREQDPQVIVYDLVPPYETSYRYLEHLREAPGMRNRQFVVTSTNAARAAELTGPGTDIFEVMGKPYDIDQIVDAIRQASRARSTTNDRRE